MNEPMVCINPDEIAEGDLTAYLYGDATPQVRAHVARCAFCAAQVEQLRLVDAHLIAQYYRAACPTAETLAAFVFDRLPPVEKLRVAAHVRTCDLCAAEVAQGRAFAAPEPPTLLERLRQALALALVARPVMAGVASVRGADWQGRFEVADLVITLALHNRRLTGRVRHRDAPPESDLSGQVWLVPDGAAGDIPQAAVDARGYFELTVSAPGGYALLLRIGDQDVSVETVTIEFQH